MDPTDKIRDSAMNVVDCCLASVVMCFAKDCESPIELALLQAIYIFHHLCRSGFPHQEPVTDPGDTWVVERQKQIGNYRVDFLISWADVKTKIVIECDGHEFHERTKEQAERDRSRDRALTRDGYCVLRFTGREIWRDPWKCAEEIESQFYSLLHKEEGN